MALLRTCVLLVIALAGRAAAAAPADYQPYVPPAAAEVSAPLYVVIAYSAIWLVLLFFVVSVWRRQRRVEDEITALRQLLAKPADRSGGTR